MGFFSFVKGLSKSSDEIAQAAVKGAAASADEVAIAAAKGASKSADDVAQAAAKSMTSNAARNLKLAGGALALAGTGYVIGDAAINAEKKNKTPLTITKIQNSSNSKNLLVTFANPENLELDSSDEITITLSNSVPSADGVYTKPKVVSKTQIELTSNVSITTEGSQGTIRIKTSFGKEIVNTVDDAADPIGDALGSTVGDIFQPIIDYVKDMMAKVGDVAMAIVIGFVSIIFLGILIKCVPLIIRLFRRGSTSSPSIVIMQPAAPTLPLPVAAATAPVVPTVAPSQPAVVAPSSSKT